MKNNLALIIVFAALLISAATEINTMTVQPKTPISVKVVTGYIYQGNPKDLESTLMTYRNMGYVITQSNYTSNGSYLIIVEKY